MNSDATNQSHQKNMSDIGIFAVKIEFNIHYEK